MKQKDGTSQLGLFNYIVGNEYEKGDLLIFKVGSQSTIAPVIEDFTATDLQNDLQYCGFYNQEVSQITSSDDLASARDEDLINFAGVQSVIKELIVYYKSEDIPATVTGSILNITTPGLYSVDKNSEGIPPYYSESVTFTVGTLRVSNRDGVLLYELLDFDNGMYFVATSTNKTWIEVTGNGVYSISARLVSKSSDYDDLIKSLNEMLDNTKNMYAYSKYDKQMDESRNLEIFTENEQAIIITLSYTSSSILNKYTIRVDSDDLIGTIYDEFGTTRKSTNILNIGAGVNVVSIYKIA